MKKTFNMKNRTARKILSGNMSEQQIKKQIMDYLQLRGIFAWVCNTGGATYPGKGGKEYHVKFGFSGVADIIGIIRVTMYMSKWRGGVFSHGGSPFGRFLAIEVKRPGGKQTLAQKAFETAVKENGGIYCLARCLQDVEKALS